MHSYLLRNHITNHAPILQFGVRNNCRMNVFRKQICVSCKGPPQRRPNFSVDRLSKDIRNKSTFTIDYVQYHTHLIQSDTAIENTIVTQLVARHPQIIENIQLSNLHGTIKSATPAHTQPTVDLEAIESTRNGITIHACNRQPRTVREAATERIRAPRKCKCPNFDN